MPNPWVNVEIKGLDQLEHKLESLPTRLADRSLRAALRAGARVILSAFVGFAPRLAARVLGVPVGFLAAHFDIHLSMRDADLAGSAYIGPQGKMDYPDRDTGGYRTKVDKKGRAHKVGRIAVASVARYLEFGTKKMAAQPFMTPAWESHKEVALNAIISNLKEGLEAEGKQ